MSHLPQNPQICDFCGRRYMGILRSAVLIDEKGKIANVWYKISPKDTPANLFKGTARLIDRLTTVEPPADQLGARVL